MITLTPKAAEQVRGIMKQENVPPGSALRLAVTKDGCGDSGTQFRYDMSLDARAADPKDTIFEAEGIRLFVNADSLPHLDGLQLDSRETTQGVEFVFNNPHARHGCGCGKTFSEEALPNHGKKA